MTDKKEAISITESFIQKNEVYNNYVVDPSNIIERKTLWYAPFKELNPNPDKTMVGAYWTDYGQKFK